MYRSANGNVDIWSLDTNRGAWSRITSDPADDVFPELYTAWHLANAARISPQVTLTKLEMIGF